MYFLIKLGRHVNHDERMDPIDFGGQRSRSEWDIYGNKLVNKIETKPLCISCSNLADMLTMMRGLTLLILEVRGQRSRSQLTRTEISCGTKYRLNRFRASSSNLADKLTMVNPIDFGGHSSKVKVMMGVIDKCGVHGDATLCVVIIILITY